MRFTSETFYDSLGVPWNATPAEIDAGYDAAVRAIRATPPPHDAKLRQLRLAHDTLSDPQRRAAYDGSVFSYASGDTPTQRVAPEHSQQPAATQQVYTPTAAQQAPAAQTRSMAGARFAEKLDVFCLWMLRGPDPAASPWRSFYPLFAALVGAVAFWGVHSGGQPANMAFLGAFLGAASVTAWPARWLWHAAAERDWAAGLLAVSVPLLVAAPFAGLWFIPPGWFAIGCALSFGMRRVAAPAGGLAATLSLFPLWVGTFLAPMLFMVFASQTDPPTLAWALAAVGSLAVLARRVITR